MRGTTQGQEWDRERDPRTRTGKLTALAVRKAIEPGRYGDGGNLYLNVRHNGSRAWVLRYALPGRKPRDMGLGSEGEVSLAQARELAREARILLREGRDPIAVRDEAAQATIGQETTFRALAATYVNAHKAGWKNEVHRAQWTSTLEAYANPILGDLSVSMIQVADVMKVLQPIWTGKPETSSRLRGRIESILDYAAAQGWRSGDNPARWKGHLSKLLPTPGKVAPVRHHAAMPWKECPAFMRDLATREGAAAQALRFTILTASRTSEVTGATWREMRLEVEEWVVPSGRMKNGLEHRVPLSAPAAGIVASQHGPDSAADAHVFPGGAPGTGLSNMAMSAVLRRMKRQDVTVHGFRSSFRDWAAEATDHPGEVAELALAHVNKNKVEAAYLRTRLFERRVQLMKDWADFLS